jgi:predicted dehydrogenase
MKKLLLCLGVIGGMIMAASCAESTKKTAKTYPVTLMTIDPGHFHAALIQKDMYPQVNPTVYVYAPDGPEVDSHLALVESYNSRAENPTHWKSVVYRGEDFLEKALQEKKGNVVMLAGNNRKKIHYIKTFIDAGLNVYADKPMCINKEGFETLKEAFAAAEKNHVLLYDIMTERYEITSILQKELVNTPAVFGQMKQGSPEDPAIVKESVHHFFKYVSGKPLTRPGWFFDTTQQGEGIVDVTTHLIDLVQWAAFPEQIIDYKTDIRLISADRWPTVLSPQQYRQVTGLPDFPAYLKGQLNAEGSLPCYANGQIDYTINGIHTRVRVEWAYEAPEGAGDTHYSVMKGTKANIIIRQGQEQNYRPELYIEPAEGVSANALNGPIYTAVLGLQRKYPGVMMQRQGDRWHIAIPDRYRVGHEAHFTQVTEKYLRFLEEGKMPEWEVPNMITKYYITTAALEMAKQK